METKDTHTQAKGKRVLIVDDAEIVAQGLGALLTHVGHTVAVAYDGPEALARAEEFAPEVVLLDIGLPGMDGYEVAVQLRQRFGKDIFLVALTGYSQSEDLQKAERAGFDRHLVKPVSIVDIERVLAEPR